MAFDLPFLSDAQRKATNLRPRTEEELDPWGATTVPRAPRVWEPDIPTADVAEPRSSRLTMAERIEEFESQGPYGRRPTLVPETPPRRGTDSLGVPTPIVTPTEPLDRPVRGMPFEEFKAQPKVADYPSETLAGLFKAGIVEQPPVLSGPTAGVTEIGPPEDKLVPFPVTSRTGETTTKLLPESRVKELNERQWRGVLDIPEPMSADLGGAVKHAMAPLDAWADLVTDAFSQVPKLARGDFGALETPTLIAEGFAAAVEDFHERPLAQQIILGIITDPLVMLKLVKVGAQVATKAPLLRLLKAEVALAAPASTGGEEVSGRLVDQIAESLANRMVRSEAGADPKKFIVVAESQPKPSEKVVDALVQSAAFDAIDKPGFTGKLLDNLPIIKGVRGAIWGTQLSDKIKHAWVGASGTEAAMRTTQSASRYEVFQGLDNVFGNAVLRGGISDAVQYIGPDNLRAGIEGSLLDIAQRPHLYNLSDEQARVLAQWQNHQHKFQRELIDEWGVRAGEFLPVEGGVFLRNVDKTEGLLDTMGQSVDQAILSGRSKTRHFQTAADRMLVDPTFDPVLDMIRLQEGMDAGRAGDAGRQVFKDGIGGLTKAEVIKEVGGEKLVKRFDQLPDTMGSLTGRLEQAAAAIEGSPSQGGGGLNDLVQRWKNQETGLRAKLLGAPESEGMEYGSFVDAMDEIVDLAVRLERNGLLEGAEKSDVYKLIQELDEVSRGFISAEAKDTRPYEYVGDGGIFRWFKGDDLDNVRMLAKHQNNPLTKVANFLDNARAGIFAGDISPIAGVQLPLGAMFRPANAVKNLVGAGKNSIESRDLLSAFRQETMAKVILENPEAARDFAFFTGIPLDLSAPTEFTIGWLTKIPKIGPLYGKANERMFSVVTRQMFDNYRLTMDELAGRGVTGDTAKTLAADISTKIYPVWHPERLGLSKSRAALLRAVPTSVSFMAQPAALLASATTGLAKLMMGTVDTVGLKVPSKTLGGLGVTVQPLTEQERIAVKLTMQMSGSIMGLSASSAATAALMRGDDPEAAIRDVMNPASGRFAALVIPVPGGKDRYIPLGGPIRGVIKAIAPRETSWSNGVPVPFARTPGYFKNRLNPLVQGQWRLFAANQDFEGGQIRSGNTAHQMLDILLYELEVATPLSVGTAVAGIRQGKGVGDIIEETVGQFAGVNVQEQTPFQTRDKAVTSWAEDNGIAVGKTYQIEWQGKVLEVDQTKKIEGFHDLQPADQKRFETENPGIFAEIDKETRRQADQAGTDAEGNPLTEGPMGWAAKRVKDMDFEQGMVGHQLDDDEKFNNGEGEMGGAEWRDLRAKRRAHVASYRQGLYGGNPEDPETVMDYFYAKIREVAGVDAKDESGKEQWPDVMGEEDWEEVFDWVENQKDPGVQDYIERNSGLKVTTPSDKAFREAQEYLQPFWNQKDYVLNNPGAFGIPAAAAADYQEMAELKKETRLKLTTPLPGDSREVMARKETNRQSINAINQIVTRHLEAIRRKDPKIQELLLRYEYSVTKELIQLQALRELTGANP
jgi:hypothetical protein